MLISKNDSLEAELIIDLADRLRDKYRNIDLPTVAQREGVELSYSKAKQSMSHERIILSKNDSKGDVRLSFFIQLATIMLTQQ
jgi:hypothetical protein